MSLLDRPIKVNQLKLKNRLVMPPMATETADLEGKVTPGLLDYYRRKAQGGLYRPDHYRVYVCE